MAGENLFHNRLHKVITKEGRTVIGQLSWVDYENRAFYLLEPNKPGMLGKDGIRFEWDNCKSVRAESEREGIFDDDMLQKWDHWDRQSGVR